MENSNNNNNNKKNKKGATVVMKGIRKLKAAENRLKVTSTVLVVCSTFGSSHSNLN